jgi:hypothetical protein
MRTGKALLALAIASISFPVIAQQTTPAAPPASPASQPQSVPAAPPPAAQAPQAAEPAQNTPATPETAAPAMSPVNGELVGKLDTKTAKAGDAVEVRTRSNAKTADGTEIPKGSKLVGKVVAVQASSSGTNSQVALQFDHVELKGGQSLPVLSQIESISPAGGGDSGTPDAAAPASGTSPRPAGTPVNGATAAQVPAAGAASQAGPGGTPAAGTVVAKNGNIAIQTTSIPGVLLANNAPGMHDPRMATASSILLGAKRDVELDGGTLLVVDVAAAGGTAR